MAYSLVFFVIGQIYMHLVRLNIEHGEEHTFKNIYTHTTYVQNYYPVYFSLRCLELICRFSSRRWFGCAAKWREMLAIMRKECKSETNDNGKEIETIGGGIFRLFVAPQTRFKLPYALALFVWHWTATDFLRICYSYIDMWHTMAHC